MCICVAWLQERLLNLKHDNSIAFNYDLNFTDETNSGVKLTIST